MRKRAALGASIDITEFEQRLRGQRPTRVSGHDSIEELAQLLRGNEAAAPADPSREAFDEWSPHRARFKPSSTAPMQATEPPACRGEEAFERELRGSFDHATSPTAPTQQYNEAASRQEAAYHDQNVDWSLDESHAYLDYGAHEEEEYFEQYERENNKRRYPKFRLWRAVAGVAVLGIVSIGWTFAHRAGASMTAREVATIAAPDLSERPRPRQDADRHESASLPKSVRSEERPIDPAIAPGNALPDASIVDTPHEPPAGPAPALEPRRVKTVSVRSESGINDDDSAPRAITTPAPPLSDAAALPANDPLTNAAVDSGSTATRERPPKTAEAPRATRPGRRKPEKIAMAPESPVVNDNDPPATITASGGGSFEIQFGDASSETEARQLMLKIAGKFGSQFGGHHLGYRHARIGGKSVYQVTLRNLGEESAVGICKKLKLAGGNCFVTGN